MDVSYNRSCIGNVGLKCNSSSSRFARQCFTLLKLIIFKNFHYSAMFTSPSEARTRRVAGTFQFEIHRVKTNACGHAE
ncbi:MAG: hypothetical protein Harvfovirus30_2 [Harvfovirus sp.]|uniref:Uncharacterized protein n=1 Tax=Harvfovirus sp. TaxID=2487768 RepID=A0A3G5A2K9_9VIRU|nr:MAG: hypothetical protein Harvfovirus30_2 [Harvfovirus sp.]